MRPCDPLHPRGSLNLPRLPAPPRLPATPTTPLRASPATPCTLTTPLRPPPATPLSTPPTTSCTPRLPYVRAPSLPVPLRLRRVRPVVAGSYSGNLVDVTQLCGAYVILGPQYCYDFYRCYWVQWKPVRFLVAMESYWFINYSFLGRSLFIMSSVHFFPLCLSLVEGRLRGVTLVATSLYRSGRRGLSPADWAQETRPSRGRPQHKGGFDRRLASTTTALGAGTSSLPPHPSYGRRVPCQVWTPVVPCFLFSALLLRLSWFLKKDQPFLSQNF